LLAPRTPPAPRRSRRRLGGDLTDGFHRLFGDADDWPLEWPAGRYAFPEVYPKMSARKDYPPDQVNVDKLATFVIE
jgi:hypothetical protein